MMLLYHVHKDAARHHQGLLIGKQHILTGPCSRKGGTYAGGTYDGGHHGIYFG